MPALWQRSIAALTPPRGWVEHRDQPEEAQLALGLLARGSLARGRRPSGEREHPQPLLRVLLDLGLDPITIGA
jgi:hypothetical protein